MYKYSATNPITVRQLNNNYFDVGVGDGVDVGVRVSVHRGLSFLWIHTVSTPNSPDYVSVPFTKHY